MSPSIRIAVVGGSIAGCTLANGLINHPKLHFDVFDGKSSFRERGAAVAIAPNAQSALRAMGMDADRLLTDAGAMKMNSSLCLVGVGKHKGRPLVQLPGGVYGVDRMQFLEVLLKNIPEERLHANKKLVAVEQPNTDSQDTYTLKFEDGSTFEGYDVVIGCDGSRSKIREIILGDKYQDRWAPRFGGYWDARGRMTPQDAALKFGKELFDPTAVNEIALVGKGSFLLFGPTDDGTVYHVIVSAQAGEKYDRSSWKTQLSREFLEESYQDWDPKFRTAVIDALMADDTGPGVVFSQWESAEAPFYYRKPGLAMIGDAAHATVPWMGQGACQSIEDAAVLSSLLGAVEDRSEVTAALAAFDSVRRGRPEHIVKQSQEAARLLTGQVSMNPDEVKHLEADKWWTDVWNIDMNAHVAQAMEQFQNLKGS